MINLDELAEEFLAECNEHLATMEVDLLVLEKGVGSGGGSMDDERIDRIFRAVHSIKGGAGIFDLTRIGELAHQAEEVLALIRSHTLAPTPDRIRVLMVATDRLRELVQNPAASNQADISETVAQLTGLRAEPPDKGRGNAIEKGGPGGAQLRTLLVEDDFASRLLLQTFLSCYGQCHVGVNGREAVEAVRSSLELGRPYHLICMDIMMPEMDGREAVRQVRALEEAHGILSTSGAKIIMTTTVSDVKEVSQCFHELCDAYLMKPIHLAELLAKMKSYQLV
jgi:two-component system chemotaxis response regulator CheY